MKKYLSFILISGLIIISFQIKKENINRFNEPTISKEILDKIPHVIEFNDTITNDTLFEHVGTNQIPIMYSRKIQTEVCIDGKCRVVFVNLFWNITGRYLGFELPNGEFLSKTEHVPFNAQEYDRLHELLSDQNSALANYSLKELVPPIDSTRKKVDAVSSATIAAVLNYIVKGAVYTTYSLWHITYGATKREVEKLTTQKLNSELVLEILASNNLKDKVWVLTHISSEMEISSELLKVLMGTISGNDVYLAERSLNALQPTKLNDEIQKELISIIADAGFLQKRLIIQKLKEAPRLNIDVAETLSNELENFNGTLVKTTLELFKIQRIDNERISEQISLLLKNDNRYIADQAYKYLETIEIINRNTLKSIEKYQKKVL